MPKDPHRHPRMHVERGQQLTAGAARVVHADAPDARLRAAGIETPVDASGSIACPVLVVNTSSVFGQSRARMPSCLFFWSWSAARQMAGRGSVSVRPSVLVRRL